MTNATPARRALGILASLVLAGAVSLTAQQAGTYKAPRTPDGQPDFQGIWQVMNSANYDLLDHGAEIGVPAGRSVVEGNVIPYTPAGLEQKKKNFANRKTDDPVGKCYFPGVPRVTYLPFPFQIVQTKNYMQILYEWGHQMRLIYTDGTPHHEEIPMWMGDSRGKWEGETFVVTSKNFSGDTWLDRAGNHHSDALEVVERYTRTGPDHIRYEVTLTDAKTYTRPWKMSMTLYRRVEPDVQLLEYECFAMSVFEGGRYDEMIKNAKPAVGQ